MSGFDLEAGHLALDFANTAIWHASDRPDERLRQYDDIVDWSVAAGLLDADSGRRLKDVAQAQPESARRMHASALELREAIYRVFVAVAHGQRVADPDLGQVMKWLRSATAHGHLVHGDGHFEWRWPQGQHLEAPLWPVAQLALDLLSGGNLDRVGQCADDRGCGYLFLDVSRNRSRRWCSMESCGNRAKARRYYERSKA